MKIKVLALSFILALSILFIRAEGSHTHPTINKEVYIKEKEPDPNAPGTLFLELFNGDSDIPNTKYWRLCEYANNAWSQHFKDVEGYENVKVEDGYLKLKATKDGDSYKNGGIRSKIGFSNNTRLEVKVRLTKKVRGGFPAIWQMPINGENWPRSGEIDLMEWIQGTPDQIYQTVHTFYINGPDGSAGVTNPSPDKNFDVTKDHIYAVDRTNDSVIFYVDGEETWRYDNMYLQDEKTKLQFPFNKFDFDVILNFSLGGLLNGNTTWAGTIYDEDLPGEMWVDWVRVTEL